MQINANSFLEFAKNITHEDIEINHRNAVSRAYYAMFHAAHENLGPIPEYKNTGSHESIEIFFQSLNIKNELYDKEIIRSALYMLKNQKLMRVKADYKLTEQLTKNDSQQAIKVAEKFLQKLKSISIIAT